MKFTKMQGAGNDFILVESGSDGTDWSRIVPDMCDRHYGIGADGLLVFMPSTKASFRMRIFNADGSESDVCGNGMRCMVRHYLDSLAPDARPEDITIETSAGLRKARYSVLDDGNVLIQTFMGTPGFTEEAIPVLKDSSSPDTELLRFCEINTLRENIRLNIISMGNPHAVYFIDKPVRDYDLAVTGPEISNDPMFTEGTNFEVARVIDRNTIEVRVWERGVGETLACGSGACAVTVAAYIKGYVDSNVNVVLPGGVLNVVWDDRGEVLLSGPSETVFTGTWPD